MHAFQFVLVAAQCPFVRAQFVIRQKFDRTDIFHIPDKSAQQMRGTFVVGIAGNDNVAHAGRLSALGQMAGEIQRFGVGNADQHLMDFGVYLFQVQHNKIGMVEQVFQDGIVMQCVAVGVETGMDAVFAAGGEPVAHKFVLQQRFAAGCGYAAARCL